MLKWSSIESKHETCTRSTGSIEHWCQVWLRPSRFSVKSMIKGYKQKQPSSPTSAARNGQKILNIKAASAKNILAPALKAWRWCHLLKSDGLSETLKNLAVKCGSKTVQTCKNMLYKHAELFIVPPGPLGLILCVIYEGVGPSETTAPHANKKRNPVMTHDRYPGMTLMAETVYMKAGNHAKIRNEERTWKNSTKNDFRHLQSPQPRQILTPAFWPRKPHQHSFLGTWQPSPIFLQDWVPQTTSLQILEMKVHSPSIFANVAWEPKQGTEIYRVWRNLPIFNHPYPLHGSSWHNAMH